MSRFDVTFAKEGHKLTDKNYFVSLGIALQTVYISIKHNNNCGLQEDALTEDYTNSPLHRFKVNCVTYTCTGERRQGNFSDYFWCIYTKSSH